MNARSACSANEYSRFCNSENAWSYFCFGVPGGNFGSIEDCLLTVGLISVCLGLVNNDGGSLSPFGNSPNCFRVCKELLEVVFSNFELELFSAAAS